jgi:hypothetical protein
MIKLRYGIPISVRKRLRPVVRRLRYAGLRSDDVLLASYPRSGMTWLRFLLAEILTGEESEFDTVNRTIPSAGGHRGAPTFPPAGFRLVQTHDLDSGPCQRAIYLVRDFRDVLLSEYRSWLRGGSSDTFETFLLKAIGGRANVFGSWMDHVEFWLDGQHARPGRILLVRFEDLRNDQPTELKRVLSFLQIERADADISSAIKHNSVNRMREKETRASGSAVTTRNERHRFVGEGKSGGWKSNLSVEQVRAIERAAGPLLIRLDYPTVDRLPG